MAATDQNYYSLKKLDIVFAVSCVLMLVSIVWMFAQDYFRDFKVEQREFRNVEEALAQRKILDAIPSEEDLKLIEEAEASVVQARKDLDAIKSKLWAQVSRENVDKVRKENDYQSLKATFDSKQSLYDIAVDERNEADGERRKSLEHHVEELRKELDGLRAKLSELDVAIQVAMAKLEETSRPIVAAEKVLGAAEDHLKKRRSGLDSAIKLAAQKRWGWGDSFRNLPVIDAFNAPTRIHQYTLDALPIDYNFKYVTRYDRCVTCHQGIERPGFDKLELARLKDSPKELQEKLANFRKAVQGRKTGINPSELPSNLLTVSLTNPRVNEFAAHPRLDLFVDANSPHPAEKFGCSICHQGQGSATTFLLATHSPNDTLTKKAWQKEHGWESSHYWDYPMLPSRFSESACLKCHHQVTDLIREGTRNEAPKLLKGYNLVRENGCFGCHEISGIKGGRWVGPDLRLEPSPPLDDYTPAERTRMTADPLNPPGAQRKVGPSLRRLSEKTHPQWVREWIRAPRDFRPDTRMPHFYGLSNNHSSVLPADQRDFPDAEVYAVAHYLQQSSEAYLKGSDRFRLANVARQKELREKEASQLSEGERRELEEITRRLELARVPKRLDEELKDLPPEPKDLARGRQLFSEKGCLACHVHDKMNTPDARKTADGLGLPELKGDANFGPDLSRIHLKLGTRPDDRVSARRWLIQWILNPTFHHPRTFMPVTHLTAEEANLIAGWLLASDEKWTAKDSPEKPNLETLEKLAQVHLSRSYTKREVEEVLKDGFQGDRLKQIRVEADEQELAGPFDGHKEARLLMYVGKKAVGQLGCYGCHDVPGFENSKPIGTPLNDWGKKDAERIAFEDAAAYVRKNYHLAADRNRTDSKGQPYWRLQDGKTPYEQYFFDALEHHQREGFLHQKLVEPRSYDYDRIRIWDDRLRMPQFRFSRKVISPEMSDEEKAQVEKEEAEAREAVMTFILGLLAEPIPPAYLNQPGPDRLAEVKGRQVLEKYNCAGCHMIRSGTIEFKMNDEVLDQLVERAEDARKDLNDHPYADHNAWVGRLQPRPDRLKVQALVQPNEDDALVMLRLTHAVRFKDRDGKELDVPGGSGTRSMVVPKSSILRATEPYGGTFANLLVKYLIDRDREQKTYKKTADGDSVEGRAAAPPVLLAQGEKTQPGWLYQFLRNPHEIRPLTVLRMPRFNLSDDEAMALVNYFASVDRTANPAIGLTYPYLAVPQRDEGFMPRKTREYKARLNQDKVFDLRIQQLQPQWEQLWSDDAGRSWRNARKEDREARVNAAKKVLADAKDEPAKKKAEKELAERQAELDALKDEAKEKAGFVAEQRRAWEEKDAYMVDAYKVIAAETPRLCLTCHRVGNIAPNEMKGPPLELAFQRLRPEWTERWLVNPSRFMPYGTPMPQNFPANKKSYKDQLAEQEAKVAALKKALDGAKDAMAKETARKELEKEQQALADMKQQDFFQGSPKEQLTAVRDLLMVLPSVADLPISRVRTAGGTGGK